MKYLCYFITIVHMDALQFLETHEINVKIYEHPPVYTVDEARLYREGIAGLHCKNLFLKDSKKKKFYLLSTLADKSIRLNKIRKQIKAKKLGFANEDQLFSKLNLTPGAVSPMGLINNDSKDVIFIVDEEIWNAELVTFHPNDNTKTVAFTNSDFKKFIELTKNPIIILNMNIEETVDEY